MNDYNDWNKGPLRAAEQVWGRSRKKRSIGASPEFRIGDSGLVVDDQTPVIKNEYSLNLWRASYLRDSIGQSGLKSAKLTSKTLLPTAVLRSMLRSFP